MVFMFCRYWGTLARNILPFLYTISTLKLIFLQYWCFYVNIFNVKSIFLHYWYFVGTISNEGNVSPILMNNDPLLGLHFGILFLFEYFHPCSLSLTVRYPNNHCSIVLSSWGEHF